jgi:hypothetical protein
MNGDNNSTTFLDSSSSPITPTVSGGAKLSTAIKKFGVSSGYFNGTDSFIYYNPSDEFALGNKEFTIETWLYFPSVPNTQMCIIGKHNHNITYDYGLYIDSATQITWAWHPGGFTTFTHPVTIPSITAETWHHIAVVRNSSGELRIYWNGTQYGGAAASNPKNSGIHITIGCDRISGPNLFLNGYMDEFRISHTARYTSNFTSPTEAFATEDGTASLPVSPKAGDIVHTNQGVFICSGESPVAWKKYAIVPT